MLSKKTYTEEKQTGYILLVALLLSTFSLSGYWGNSQPLQKATQIELVFSKYQESTKDTVYIYEIFETCESVAEPFSKICPVNYLSFYKQLIETQFRSVSQKVTLNKASNHFYPIKTIPLNSKEDSFISLIG